MVRGGHSLCWAAESEKQQTTTYMDLDIAGIKNERLEWIESSKDG
jgi:hypothetical protein